MFENEKKPDDPKTPLGVTMEQVQQLLNAKTAELQTQNAELQRQLNASLVAQRQQAPASVPAPLAPVVQPTAQEFVDSLTDDPKAAIDARVERQMNERFSRLAPHLEQQLSTTSAGLVNTERQKFETEYGPDAWAKHIEPTLTARLATLSQTDATALGRPEVIRQEVLSAMGREINALNEVKTTRAKEAENKGMQDVAKLIEAFSTTGMSGGQLVVNGDATRPLDQTELDYTRAKADEGETVNIGKLRQLQNQPMMTLDDYNKLEKPEAIR